MKHRFRVTTSYIDMLTKINSKETLFLDCKTVYETLSKVYDSGINY